MVLPFHLNSTTGSGLHYCITRVRHNLPILQYTYTFIYVYAITEYNLRFITHTYTFVYTIVVVGIYMRKLFIILTLCVYLHDIIPAI